MKATMSRPTASAPRPPGRPRSARADRAILGAATELLVEQGFDAMTIEGVAELAGVGKTTIYRRWPTKEDLVVAAVGGLSADVAIPDTGSVREDLVGLLEQMARLLSETVPGRALPRMVAEVAAGTGVGRAYADRVIGPRRAMFALVLRRGLERNELPADLDVELAIDMLMGPVIVRRLLGGPRGPSTKGLAGTIVDGLIAGVAARRTTAG